MLMLLWDSKILLHLQFHFQVRSRNFHSCFFMLKILFIVLKVSYNQPISSCLTKGDFLVGFLCFGSMYCSNFALKYVNYPFVVLSKSAKIMPGIINSCLNLIRSDYHGIY